MSVAERPTVLKPEEAAEPRPHRWTVDEYFRAAEMGLFRGRRVQLLEGEILEMSPQNHPHAAALSLTDEAVRRAFGPGFWVRMQMDLLLGADSDPEPDIAVVRGAIRDYSDHPTTAVLVVEVADSSLAHDRTRKAGLYAKAGIADYWMVNLADRQLEVRRHPIADVAEPSGFRYAYAEVMLLSPGESIAPLAAPAGRIAVNDLLP